MFKRRKNIRIKLGNSADFIFCVHAGFCRSSATPLARLTYPESERWRALKNAINWLRSIVSKLFNAKHLRLIEEKTRSRSDSDSNYFAVLVSQVVSQRLTHILDLYAKSSQVVRNSI